MARTYIYCNYCGKRLAKSKARIIQERPYCHDNQLCLDYAALPTPVKTDSRICFGIKYFASEEEASRYAEWVKARELTYNGGFYHGMPCGRETVWDHIDKATGRKLYAVTC
jgi:hypothetical protein